MRSSSSAAPKEGSHEHATIVPRLAPSLAQAASGAGVWAVQAERAEDVMSFYRKKPVVIEAMLWTGYNYTESELFMGEPLANGRYEVASAEAGNGWGDSAYGNSAKIIPTLEGEMRCQPGDWIIRGITGEFYPIKDEIFLETYEQVAP